MKHEFYKLIAIFIRFSRFIRSSPKRAGWLIRADSKATALRPADSLMMIILRSCNRWLLIVQMGLLSTACLNIRAQAVQSDNPGKGPQQAVFYIQAASAYSNAASQADAAGQTDRADCFRHWAAYYTNCAAQLVSGTAFRAGNPPANDCSGFADAVPSGSAPPTGEDNAGTSFGITPKVWNNLGTGQKGLITGLSALSTLLQQQQHALRAQQQAEENETDQSRKALNFWIPAAKRFKDITKQPAFDEFLPESSFSGKALPNPDWYIESLEAGGARADFAVKDSGETAQEIEQIEMEFALWQIKKVNRDAQQAAENAEIADEASGLSDDPEQIHKQLVECFKTSGGCDYQTENYRFKTVYPEIKADLDGLSVEYRAELIANPGDDGIPVPKKTYHQTITISWKALKDADITLTEEFTAKNNRPFKVIIKTLGNLIKYIADTQEDTYLSDSGYFYLGSDAEAAHKLVVLLQRAAHVVSASKSVPSEPQPPQAAPIVPQTISNAAAARTGLKQIHHRPGKGHGREQRCCRRKRNGLAV